MNKLFISLALVCHLANTAFSQDRDGGSRGGWGIPTRPSSQMCPPGCIVPSGPIQCPPGGGGKGGNPQKGNPIWTGSGGFPQQGGSPGWGGSGGPPQPGGPPGWEGSGGPLQQGGTPVWVSGGPQQQGGTPVWVTGGSPNQGSPPVWGGSGGSPNQGGPTVWGGSGGPLNQGGSNKGWGGTGDPSSQAHPQDRWGGSPRNSGGDHGWPGCHRGPPGPPSNIFDMFPACACLAESMRTKHFEMTQSGQIGPGNCPERDYKVCIKRDLETMRCEITEEPQQKCIDEVMAFVRGEICDEEGEETDVETKPSDPTVDEDSP